MYRRNVSICTYVMHLDDFVESFLLLMFPLSLCFSTFSVENSSVFVVIEFVFVILQTRIIFVSIIHSINTSPVSPFSFAF